MAAGQFAEQTQSRRESHGTNVDVPSRVVSGWLLPAFAHTVRARTALGTSAIFFYLRRPAARERSTPTHALIFRIHSAGGRGLAGAKWCGVDFVNGSFYFSKEAARKFGFLSC